MTKADPLPLDVKREFLQDFHLNLRFLQHAVLVDRQSDEQSLLVVPLDPVVFDGKFWRPSSMFGRRGRGEMPFNEGSA